MYPENTLLAFEKAAELDGLEGIEFDIQMTKDGELVVIHDERVDRTTEGTGYVKDYLFSQLRRLHIYAGSDRSQSIPAIEEVLDLLEDKIRSGLKINIELKNSIFPYEGMEEKIVSLINRRGMQESVVYSSFNALSVEKIRKISGGGAKTGIRARNFSDCLYTLNGGGGAEALQP